MQNQKLYEFKVMKGFSILKMEKKSDLNTSKSIAWPKNSAQPWRQFS